MAINFDRELSPGAIRIAEATGTELPDGLRLSRSGPMSAMAARMRLVRQTAPLLSRDMTTVNRLVNSGIDDRQLARAARQAEKFWLDHMMADALMKMPEEEGRREWAKMSDRDRRRMAQIDGFETARFTAAAGASFMDRLKDFGDKLSDVGNLMVAPVAVIKGFEEFEKRVDRGYAYGRLRGQRQSEFIDELYRTGEIPEGGFAERVTRQAWRDLDNPERIVLPHARTRALELLDGDDDAFQDALEAAAYDSVDAAISGLAEEAGPIGSREYANAYQRLYARAADDKFGNAVETLRRGKIDIGGDIARLLTVDDTYDNGLFTIVSETGELAVDLAIDPFIVAAKAAKAHRLAKRGIDLVTLRNANALDDPEWFEEAAVAFRSAVLSKGSSEGWKVAAARQITNPAEPGYVEELMSIPDGYVREAAMVTDYLRAGAAGDTRMYGELYRRRPRYGKMHDELVKFGEMNAHRRGQMLLKSDRIDTATISQSLQPWEDAREFHEFIASASTLDNIVKGYFGAPIGTAAFEMPHLSKLSLRAGELKVGARRQIDFLAQNPTEVISVTADQVHTPGGILRGLVRGQDAVYRIGPDGFQLLDAQGVVTETVKELGMNLLAVGAKTYVQLASKLPRTPAMRLAAAETYEELDRMLSMGMSGDERIEWIGRILSKSSVGARREEYFSALKAMFNNLGLTRFADGQAYVDDFIATAKHGYSATGNDVRVTPWGRMVSAIWPGADTSMAIAFPNYKEMRELVGQANRLGLTHFLYGSAPARVFDAFMGIWRPSVLLRLGFPVRAALEEGLAFMFREGPDKLFQHGWYIPAGTVAGAVVGAEQGGLAGGVAGAAVGTAAGIGVAPFPVARRPNEELLLPIRTVNRALTWTMGRDVVHETALARWIEERALTSKFLTDYAAGATKAVRNAARAAADLPGRKGIGEGRLKAAQEIYELRKQAELYALDRQIAEAERLLEAGQVQGQRIAVRHQKRLVRTLKNQRLRLKWAEELGHRPEYVDGVMKFHGEIAGSGLLEGHAPVEKLRGTVAAVVGKRGGRPKYIRMSALGSTFSEQQVSEVGLGALQWRLARLDGDPLAEPMKAAAALHVDKSVYKEAQDFLDELADGISSPFRRGKPITAEELVRVMRDSWQETDIRFRGALKDYLHTGDAADLQRATNFLYARGDVDTSWMKLFLEHLDQMPPNVSAAVMVDRAEMARKAGIFDNAVVEALESGDRDLLNQLGPEVGRKALTKIDSQKLAQLSDRVMATADGRRVSHPPQAGHARVYTVLIDQGDIAKIGEAGPIDDPRVGAALTRLLRVTADTGLVTDGLRPVSRWATSDEGLAHAVAAEIGARTGGRVQLGWMDVPTKSGKRHTADQLDVDEISLYKLRVLNPDDVTLEEAIDDWARVAWRELRDLTFSRRNGAPLPALLRPMADDFDVVDTPHLMGVASDLPRSVLAPERVLYQENIFEKVVSFGWDKVVTPMISAMIREPMFIEAYMVRRFQAQAIEHSLRDKKLVSRGQNLALRIGKPDLSPGMRATAEQLEQLPIKGEKLEGQIGVAVGGPDPDVMFAGERLGRQRILLDEEDLRTEWEAGLPSLRGVDGPNTVSESLRAMGVSPDELHRWFENNGGIDAFRRFVIEHERGHHMWGHTYDMDLANEPGRIIERAADRARTGDYDDPIDVLERAQREKGQWDLAKEIQATNYAFASLGMPFGPYSGMLDADRALDELRRQWKQVPAELKRKSVDIVKLRASSEVGPWIKKLNEKEIGLLREVDDHLRVIEEHTSRVAMEGAFNDTIGYIDDSRLRSQFQESVRNFMPFQFAEEQFIKRWARTFKHSPESFRKAMLLVGFMRDVGLIEQDEYGDWQYIVPGSAAMFGAFNRAYEAVTGREARLPIVPPMGGSVLYSIPGGDFRGIPSVSPLVAMSLKFAREKFPELEEIAKAEDLLVGPRGRNRDYLQLVVPATMVRFYEAVVADPEASKMFASAEHDAIRVLMSDEKTALPDDATPLQIAEFQERVRQWTRSLLLFRSAFGWATPAPPDPKIGESLNPEFRKLLSSGIGYEEAIERFMLKYPDATAFTVFSTKSVGGALMPATKAVGRFLDKHSDFVSGYTHAAGYLLPYPGDLTEPYEHRAYTQQLATGLRLRKDSEALIKEIKFQEAADLYFESAAELQKALDALPPGDPQRGELKRSFRQWKNEYFKLHPIFAEQLQSGEGYKQRMRTLNEMRSALGDPRLPSRGIPHLKAMRTLVESYDEFRSVMSELADARDKQSIELRKSLRDDFDRWARSHVRDDPQVKHFYFRVVRPDIRGLEEVDE